VYPTYSAIYNQDGLQWSTVERYTRAERQSVTPTEALFHSLSDGTELTADKMKLFTRGLLTIVDWVSILPVYPPSFEGWTLEARKAHVLEIEYRMTILRYVLAFADSIMAEICPLSAQSYLGYRLLEEFTGCCIRFPSTWSELIVRAAVTSSGSWGSKRQASKSCGTNWVRILQVCRRCSAA
jgi:hypothetical protein